MTETFLRTPLCSWHAAHGARLVPFGGWEMPVQYASIVAEHTATRTAVGLFDISHMGRITFAGPGSTALLDRLLTNSVVALKPGRVRYSLVVNESGGILDDVLVYCAPTPGAVDYLLVVNASNRPRIVNWIGSHMTAADAVEMQDRTFEWAMIAVQGPRSLELVQPLVRGNLQPVAYYHFTAVHTCDTWGIASRTGYTGEDGFELIVPAEKVVELWEKLIAAGDPLGLKPCGLGARDTLRLEAAMPLYGHELTEEIDPFMAGLDWAVKLDNRDFIGKRALLAAKQAYDAGLSRRRVGLELEGKRIAREGYAVMKDGVEIGRVTSGTFAPTLAKSIAMAYVLSEFASEGAAVAVDVRGQEVPARIVKLPFYNRKKNDGRH